MTALRASGDVSAVGRASGGGRASRLAGARQRRAAVPASLVPCALSPAPSAAGGTRRRRRQGTSPQGEPTHGLPDIGPSDGRSPRSGQVYIVQQHEDTPAEQFLHDVHDWKQPLRERKRGEIQPLTEGAPRRALMGSLRLGGLPLRPSRTRSLTMWPSACRGEKGCRLRCGGA